MMKISEKNRTELLASILPHMIKLLLKLTSAKYSVGADILSSASVYSEMDKLWLKSSFDVDVAIGMTELVDSFTLTELLPFGSSIMMT